jgi:hypothetical protein
MNNEDEKNDLIKILSGKKRKWLVQVDYFTHNVRNYIDDDNLDNGTFKIIFSVKANSEKDAKDKAIEIYESEFGIENLKNIAQSKIEDTDALDITKFKNGVLELKFYE